jgi:hypothetical protein
MVVDINNSKSFDQQVNDEHNFVKLYSGIISWEIYINLT